jgi:hypothetical protein
LQFFVQQRDLSIFSLAGHWKGIKQEGAIVIGGKHNIHAAIRKVKAKVIIIWWDNSYKAAFKRLKFKIIRTFTTIKRVFEKQHNKNKGHFSKNIKIELRRNIKGEREA